MRTLQEDVTEHVLMALTIDELCQLLSNAGPDDKLRRRLQTALDLLETA